MERIDRYQFKPLLPSQVRLLKLLPGCSEDKIELELSVASLDSLTNFTYVSYVWGNTSDSHTVLCNGQHMDVPTNLTQFLQEFRERKWTQNLWIDAICVNQRDTEERARQSRLTSNITSIASNTILWLGQGSHEIELLFQHCLAVRSLPGPDHWYWPEIELGLSELAENRALKRLWILLDIVHARSLKVWYGRCECFYEDIIWGLYTIYCDLDNPIARSSCSGTILLGDSLRRRHQARSQITFTEMIQASRFFQCANLSDHVFASMQIIGAQRMHPDYSSTIAELYMNTALVINDELFPASLAMLEDTRTAISGGFPSWVPDLSVPVQRKPLIHTDLQFSASMNYPEQSVSNPMSSHEASLLGEVAEVFGCTGFITDSLMSVFDYNPVRQWYDERNLEALNNSFLAMWFDSAMLAARASNQLASQRAFTQFIETILALPNTEIQQNAAERMRTARAWLSAIQGESDETTESMKDFHQACAFAFGRRFGVTARGQFCLIPRNSQPRDSVCILYGSKVPFVLRRIENGWQNIGECYVHGIMNGEALDRDRAEDVVFHIR